MTKDEQIEFTKSFLKEWEALSEASPENEEKGIMILSEKWNKFLESENLPKESADETLFRLTGQYS